MNNAAHALQRVVARSWLDDSFRRALLADPAAALAAEGIALPAGTAVRVVEDSDDTVHLALPPRPAELSDDDLDQVVGGELVMGLMLGGVLLGLGAFGSGLIAGFVLYSAHLKRGDPSI